MSYEYSAKEIENRVAITLGVLLKNDSFLLQINASERSVSHKLGEYLQAQFPDWDVDCEYYRKGLDPKILERISECSDQRRTDRVLPDIIVHKRNTNDNLLVIEMKLENEDPCDIEKLKKFTSSTGEFRYKLGLFIRFDSRGTPSLRWYKDGNEVRNCGVNC